MLEINILDIAVAVVLLVFLGRGLVRGLTREVTGLLGVVGGFLLARKFQYAVQPYFEPLTDDPNISGIAAFVVILTCTMLTAALLGAALRKFMSVTLTSWVDYILGALAGFAKGLLIVCLIFFLVQGFLPELAIVKTARSTPLINALIEYIRGLLPAAFTYKLPSLHL